MKKKKNKLKPIRIIITGGTIDCSFYNPETEEYEFKESFIPRMLKQARITYPVKIEKLMLKDSREITKKDRELILKRCKKCKEDRIIITHGTYTMVKTAKFLGKNLKEKTIVLVGSIVPFYMENSDALFNLGFALGVVQLLPSGVYIAMNGKIFTWNNVRKNLEKDIFEEIK